MRRREDYAISKGNVFEDLGLPDAGERLVKAELARQIGALIGHRHLTQTDAARVLGTTQPKVSDLQHGRLAGFSMERLLRFLLALDRDVRIVVSQKPANSPRARLLVAGPFSPPAAAPHASSAARS